ncbi:MAG: hypothetical protein WC454_01775 [Phycisphaerae bacterium]|jgi:hypothetical protein
MNTKKLFFYLLAGILGGCLPVMSLHPLFTEKDVAYDEKLIGTWEDPNGTVWQFSDANEPEKAYKFIFTDKEGKKGTFVAHLVKLENRLFLDVYPSEPPWDETDPNKVEWLHNTFFFIPVHTFIKVNETEPQLKLQLTDDEELKSLLNDDPNAVEYTSTKDRLVLTASTKGLQEFVLKYADDSRLFTEEIPLTRKKTDDSQKSAEKKSKNSDPNKS